ncbi:DUF1127 domain-containing protein [Bradyrhizobium sp. Ai1a-2]|uniref:DUF1127 domain-containing protein n=1 Tax=Bradyrhizobium sp. Ai1a-2 TaxID=196490 RepID=UPI001FCA92D2|nr:DUF1127 domain-containing protein [Bradyrhizobium sp. Ai1a-2]
MLYTEQLLNTRPQSRSRAPYRNDRRAALERSSNYDSNYDKAQILLPWRDLAQPDRQSGQEAAVRADYPTQTQQAPEVRRWYVSIGAMVMFVLSKMRDELEIRRAMAELRELDDRMLRDIGLSRCDIASVRRREI